MAETLVIFRGDSATPLAVEIPTTPSGRTIVAGDQVFFRFRPVGSATGTVVEGVWHSVAARRARYDWPNAAATQALVVSEYILQCTVRYLSDGKEETVPDDNPENTDAAEAVFPSKFIVRDRIAATP
jgi:hypothetical protein